jgi:hypothetical protein
LLREDGGNAFPESVSADNEGGLNHGDPGMSLRDYFAGRCVGVFALRMRDGLSREEAAEQAYKLADAMLAERSKPCSE